MRIHTVIRSLAQPLAALDQTQRDGLEAILSADPISTGRSRCENCLY